MFDRFLKYSQICRNVWEFRHKKLHKLTNKSIKDIFDQRIAENANLKKNFFFVKWTSFTNNTEIYWVGLMWSSAKHYLAFGIVLDVFV